MAGKLLKVEVSKKSWFRGQGVENSRLLCKTGNNMCCIGFLGRTLGLKPEQLRGIATLETLADSYRGCGVASVQPVIDLADNHGESLVKAYYANDDEEITDHTRITTLKKIGKEMNVNFVFVP
jgi:hypothetical protein